MDIQKDTTAKQRYEKLAADRFHFLDRARDCAELTIPSLIPDESFSESSKLYTPFQSVGARGVNNLSSKLLLLLLPPNSPFFRFSISGKAKEELDQQKEVKASVEEALGKMEREIAHKIERLALRVSTFEALKHLIVAGNVLTYLPKEGNMRVYPLTQYVCTRDSSGTLLEIVIKENISPLSLDDETRAELEGQYKDDESLDIFTHIYKIPDKKYYVCQEIKGIKLQTSIGTFTENNFPYMALRMIRVDNEDYGRSYVEEFLGDLKSLEGLSQSLVESAAASSKVVFMVKPNSVTRKSDLAQTRNGDIITGTREDVTCLQTEKQYDLQIVERSISKLEERLSFAFLLHTAIQREAERVTAQEIRYMAQQLETSMGGVYSLLSQEFQLPLVNVLMKRMQQTKEIPTLPKGSVEPVIITGIEALGRGNDLQKLREFVMEIMNVAQINPQIAQALNTQDLVTRIATGLGIDVEGLIKTQDQLQAEQEAAMEQQQEAMMTEKTMDVVGPAAAEAVKNEVAE
jgi:hypothetical protein|tara:strand:+ start:1684 stop:3234 length:1551 start_codon:yes stop_codon:yes gene_type:complete